MEALLVREAVGAKIVEDEQMHSGKFFDEPGEAPVEAGERQILEHARYAHIENGMVEPGRLPSEGAGQP
ncbi:hypothetical protein MesoLj131a_63060 [Mesorhizobium sp. 131-2-1]|nr:hypothetical protein MesoLj131a_63060 [Mesorhizobium sp. 131-2-1]